MEEKQAFDYLILFVVFSLLFIGLIMILSSSSIRSHSLYNDSYYLFKHQLLWAVVGIIIMIIFMNFDYHHFKKYYKLILLFTIAGLFLVLMIGDTAGGARRWINLGFVRIQPSEIAKLGFVIYLSAYFSRKKERILSFTHGVLPTLIIMVIIFGLILVEPDLGTAISIAGTFFVMLFASGAKIFHMLAMVLMSLPLLFYFIITEEYRLRRLLSFLNPWADPLDSGYHIIQSLLALGSGGLFGVGLGQSKQKFLYLPEPGTDFIFAVLGEELGLLGTLLVIVLFFLFAWRGLRTAVYAADRFGSMLAVGITATIVIQTIINIAVVTSSMPVTGITLPFISYGGTSLVIMLAATGILINISRQTSK